MDSIRTTKKYLTPKQHAVLDFIRKYVETHGYPPTRIELAHGVNLKETTAQYFLNILEKKKYIKTPGRKNRNVRLIN